MTGPERAIVWQRRETHTTVKHSYDVIGVEPIPTGSWPDCKTLLTPSRVVVTLYDWVRLAPVVYGHQVLKSGGRGQVRSRVFYGHTEQYPAWLADIVADAMKGPRT